MIGATAIGVGILELLIVLAFVGGLVAVVRPSMRKYVVAAPVVLVLVLFFFRVSSVHYVQTPAERTATVRGEPEPMMDVEQASAPQVHSSMRQAAESLVANAARPDFEPLDVRLYSPVSVQEPMRLAVLHALRDRYVNANITSLVTSMPTDAPGNQGLNLSLQPISSYTRGSMNRTTRGARFRLTAITVSGSRSAEAEYQEHQYTHEVTVPAVHVRVEHKPGVAIVGTVALVLMLYFGLNAWTRGYFQTRLRFLAAALLLLGVVLVMLLA